MIQALKHRLPNLKITLRTLLPESKLIERFDFDVAIQSAQVDIGLVQADALNVLKEQSARAYATFHRNWEDRISQEAETLIALGADLVVANAPYLPLAGAARAGIPGVALCSLNWAEAYRHYFADCAGRDRIVRDMLKAYNQARCFLQPEPSIPMPGLHNAKRIGPIAQVGRNRREELAERLGLKNEERLVLLSLGGMDHRLPVENWPAPSGIRIMLPRRWQVSHPQAVDIESLDMPFIDLLGSCDALITKTGYGSFVEAACAGVPVLYLKRADWVETPVLTSWLESHGRCLALEPKRLERGEISQPLNELLAQSAPPSVTPAGIQQAVDEIVALGSIKNFSTAESHGKRV